MISAEDFAVFTIDSVILICLPVFFPYLMDSMAITITITILMGCFSYPVTVCAIDYIKRFLTVGQHERELRANVNAFRQVRVDVIRRELEVHRQEFNLRYRQAALMQWILENNPTARPLRI